MIPQDQFEKVAKAFSSQSLHFDEDEKTNSIVADMRAQVRAHVLQFLQPDHRMLELNAGTGLDAVFFSSYCKEIVATDISKGMLEQLQQKIIRQQISNISHQLLSYTNLDQLREGNFNYVFSNFGGLNCIQDLSLVVKPLISKLASGACLTLVIMPPFCLWETMNVFKGNFRLAFRRWKKEGARSHLEGEFFQTFYFTPKQVMRSFGKNFKVMQLEALGVFLPQPHQQAFSVKHPNVYPVLKSMDRSFRNHFPFNRWGDHFIITLKYQS